jgi:DNA-binding IclR family transcriptional regulator
MVGLRNLPAWSTAVQYASTVCSTSVKGQRSPDSPGTVQVIARAGRVLRAVDDEPGGLSLAHLTVRLGLPRSTVHRLVSALIAEGLLAVASPTGRVRIGPGFARAAAASQQVLWHEVAPFMRRIYKALDETVDCSVLGDGHVRVVHLIAATHQLRVVAEIGTRFPLHCSSRGKALLAELAPEKVLRLLPAKLERFTDNTVTSVEALMDELATIRETGVAFDLQEHTPNVCAAAVAIREPFGAAVSVSVAAPAHRFLGRQDEIRGVLCEMRKEATATFQPSEPPTLAAARPAARR